MFFFFLCILFICFFFFFFFFFFFNDTATTEIYTLSLHDALRIFHRVHNPRADLRRDRAVHRGGDTPPARDAHHRVAQRWLRGDLPGGGLLGGDEPRKLDSLYRGDTQPVRYLPRHSRDP